MVCEDTLRVKNLPNELSDAEKEEFLVHFGAINVNIITSKARQHSVAFAKFESKETAKSVMFRLHQITILNSRLCVEYADHDIGYNSDPKMQLKIKKDNEDESKKKCLKLFLNKLNAFNSSVNFCQPPPPHLKYVYPKPNRATINNIAHALASVPKFYTQVLHLMNKMNLPPPFSNAPDPPNSYIPKQNVVNPVSVPPKSKEGSSSESELESDTEENSLNNVNIVVPAKRKLQQNKMVKRPKFIKPTVIQPTSLPKVVEKPEDVFEKVEFQPQQKIELKLSTDSLADLQTKAKDLCIETNSTQIEPDGEVDTDKIISEEELNKNRVPLEELKSLPIFKDYNQGVPTNKIYIKNIAKAVEVKDLEYIYKRYMDKEKGEENCFNIRLMQEGRMKGQAFVTFNSVEKAQKAVEETNGYMIKDKRLVVVFAKSAATKKD